MWRYDDQLLKSLNKSLNLLTQCNHLGAETMENPNHDQALLSEQLLLIQELDFDYSDHRLTRDDFGREMKLLETIALLLSTGLPGEHFAAAFDKRQGLEVVLAKNGSPNSEDTAAARELFSHLCNPEIKKARDLFPFVARRCRANVITCVQKLRASIIDTGFYDDFCSEVDQYSPACDLISPSMIILEFGRSDSLIQDYTGEPLSDVLKALLDTTLEATGVSEMQDVEEFVGLYILSSTLARCRFLRLWSRTTEVGHQKVQRFQRRTKKLCRYIDDVHSLIKGAKRLGGPIKHRWVTDEALGIQLDEEDIRIHAETPLEAVHRASVLSSQQLEELNERKPSIVQPWQRRVHICLHAELRIILHFGRVSMSGLEDLYQPIGLSKPSCLCCALWISAYNNVRDLSIRWETLSYYKPDANWALTAFACPKVQNLDLWALDEKVVSGVRRWLLRYASGIESARMLYLLVGDTV